MKLEPNKIISVELTVYEIITALTQLTSSVPSYGNQTTIVNITNKLRKAVEDESSRT